MSPVAARIRAPGSAARQLDERRSRPLGGRTSERKPTVVDKVELLKLIRQDTAVRKAIAKVIADEIARGNRTIRETVVEEVMKEVESSLRDGKLGIVMEERTKR
jgi:hypothetical protein